MRINNRLLGLAFTVCLANASLAETQSIKMSATAPYSDPSTIQLAVLNECNLPTQQAELIEKIAAAQGITVIRTEENPKSGKYLKLSITNAVSAGNAFRGHSKFVTLKGVLFDNGVEIGDFTATRHSMGGMFGAYKGSCSVLGRCVEAIAKDVSMWLLNPTKNARLGD